MLRKNILTPLLFLLIMSILLGVISTHYLENFQATALFKFRNLVYFGSTNDIIEENGSYSREMKDIGKVFNPVAFAQQILPAAQRVLEDTLKTGYINADTYVREDNKVIANANKLYEYLDTIYTNENELYLLRYNFPYKYETINCVLDPGWVSGMAQGHAAQIMLAAYILTKESSYLKSAEKILNALNVDIKDGGVRDVINNNEYWYEEYASSTYNYTHYPRVLNGHIFAMDGLFYMSHLSDDPLWPELYSKGLEAIESNIDNYSLGLWSRYDAIGTIANAGYHKIHIKQLKRISTDKTIEINKNLKKFIMGIYIPIGIFYRLILAHNKMLIVNVLLNIVIIYIVLILIYLVRRKILKRC